MNTAILLSIRPKWCKLIKSGKKTIEIRKNVPTEFYFNPVFQPFKVYIYETKGKLKRAPEIGYTAYTHDGSGAVIGEFTCDYIYKISIDLFEIMAKKACLTVKELADYLNGDEGYGWHISNLIIYNKPKELGEFTLVSIRNKESLDGNEKPVKSPPISWCRVKPITII